MRSFTDWINLLRRVPIFSSFMEPQLGLLAKKVSLVSYPKGAVLYEQGAPGDSLFIIVSGSIRVHHRNEVTSAGRRPTILGRGDSLGELALISGERRTHTAVVDATADLLVLQKRDFDLLLKKNPAMALHLSRVLSSQLASVAHASSTDAEPGRIFSIITAIPHPDQVLLSVNLGISLVEQTREKVLLCCFDRSGMTAETLGLERHAGDGHRAGLPDGLEHLHDAVMVHPSGLEVLNLDPRLFEGPISGSMMTFFAMVREQYDFAVFMLPPSGNDLMTAILHESNRVLVAAGPQSSHEDVERIRRFEPIVAPSKKLEKIWLSDDYRKDPKSFTPDMRLYWKSEWSAKLLNQGQVFLSTIDPRGQRDCDRLARALGNLLIGFAMGSGAAFGYSLIGMLRVLEREGIHPDIVSGTSMGALIGAFYAAGYSADDMERIAGSINWRRLWAMADFGLPRSGILTGHGVMRLLREYLGDRTFRDLNLPFACVATDIQSGKEIQLDQGNVVDAVRASISLPFFFQPFYLDGRYLVDGGLVNPVPTSLILSMGANVIISANLTSKAGERRVPHLGWRQRLPSVMRGPTIPEVLIKTIYIMQYEIAAARSELSHVVLQMKPHQMMWWDLDQAKQIIHMGEASAEENVSKIKSHLPFFADSCRLRGARRRAPTVL